VPAGQRRSSSEVCSESPAGIHRSGVGSRDGERGHARARKAWVSLDRVRHERSRFRIGRRTNASCMARVPERYMPSCQYRHDAPGRCSRLRGGSVVRSRDGPLWECMIMLRDLLRRPCPSMQIESLPLRHGRQLAFFRRTVLAIAWLVAVSGTNAADKGSVCIADVPVATPGEKSLYNAAASDAPYDFTVRIGDRPPVATSHDQSVLVQGLAISAAHRVVIKRNGKPFASFLLRIADYKSEAVCMWFGPFYESWSVWPMAEAKHICACDAPK